MPGTPYPLRLALCGWLATAALAAAQSPEPTVLKVLSYPAVQPARQIDYVLARPAARWRFRDCSVVDEAVASDHRPLLAEVVLLPEAKPAE